MSFLKIKLLPPAILLFALTLLSCNDKELIVEPREYWPAYENDSTLLWMGKVYHKVKIGSQTWLKENLDAGVMIHSSQNQSDNGIIEKYYYNNDSINYSYLGGLYQWNEAMAYRKEPGNRGICPPGWHIATASDIDTLLEEVNYNTNSLKALGTGTGEGMGTNSSGFSMLPAGGLAIQFGGYGTAAHYWTSTEYDPQSVLEWSVYFFDGFSDWGNNYRNKKEYAFSIRCVKDR